MPERLGFRADAQVHVHDTEYNDSIELINVMIRALGSNWWRSQNHPASPKAQKPMPANVDPLRGILGCRPRIQKCDATDEMHHDRRSRSCSL